MKLNNQDLYYIIGGGISASMLNSMARIIESVIEVGKMIGTSIRRLFGKNYC